MLTPTKNPCLDKNDWIKLDLLKASVSSDKKETIKG